MSWFSIPFLIFSVWTACCSAGKVVKIVKEPANYGSFQSHQSNNPQAKPRLTAYRKEMHFSGPYHLRKLLGKCFTLTDSSYKYELCPFFNITQHEQTWRWNAFHGILGVWRDWAIVNNTFEAMVMDDGDECPGASRRKSKVFLKCGDQNTLVSVREPSTCHYEVVFKTPLACPLDAFLVYPVLSAEDQKKWEAIEECLFHGEITPQGYKKERDKLFLRAGLHVAKQSKTETMKEFESKSEKIDHLFVPKTEFQTKQECAQAYSELLYKYMALRRLQNSSVETNNKTSKISDVALITNNSAGARGDLGLRRARGDMGLRNDPVDTAMHQNHLK